MCSELLTMGVGKFDQALDLADRERRPVLVIVSMLPPMSKLFTIPSGRMRVPRIIGLARFFRFFTTHIRNKNTRRT